MGQNHLIEKPIRDEDDKITQVSYSVQVDYRATGYRNQKKETKSYEKSSQFTRAFENLSTDIAKNVFAAEASSNANSNSYSTRVAIFGSGGGGSGGFGFGRSGSKFS